MADTGYHPRILSDKYGHTGNVKLLELPFVVRWPNLYLKITIVVKQLKMETF